MDGERPPLFKFETMPIYVINLDRRPDRWETFLKNPYTKTFQNVERFSAFDGKTLDLSGETRISLHTRDTIRKKFRRSHYEINTLGAVGASFSHFGCWKKLLASDSEYAMIFEDDIYIGEKYFEKAKWFARSIPRDFDIWILGFHPGSLKGTPMMKGSPWIDVKSFTGAHCYIISRRGAEELLKEAYPVETHVEFYMTTAAKERGLRFFAHRGLRVPAAVEFQLENDSDTLLTKTCPLCFVPDDPRDSYFIVSQMGIAQAAVALAAMGFVGWGLAKN